MIHTKKLRLPFDFDVDALQYDLDQFTEEDWTIRNHLVTKNDEWHVLPLRTMGGNYNLTYGGPAEMYQNTEFMKRTPYFQKVLDTFQCGVAAVRLVSLRAGGSVGEHKDTGFAYEDGIARIFIPIRTHSEATFTIEDEEMHFPAGETWYVNADCNHAVYNRGTTDRIHLLIDLSPNPWLDQVFLDAGYQTQSKSKYGDEAVTDDNVESVIEALLAMGTPESKKLAREMRVKHQLA